MTIARIKSIYRVPNLTYLLTSIFGKHYIVHSIKFDDNEIKFKEAYLSHTNNCLLLTDIDSNNMRIPFIVKKLKKLGTVDFLHMDAYEDENENPVHINKEGAFTFITMIIQNKECHIIGK